MKFIKIIYEMKIIKLSPHYSNNVIDKIKIKLISYKLWYNSILLNMTDAWYICGLFSNEYIKFK